MTCWGLDVSDMHPAYFGCRRRPYAVVLFDEVEKAHGDVFNVLLQVPPRPLTCCADSRDSAVVIAHTARIEHLVSRRA